MCLPPVFAALNAAGITSVALPTAAAAAAPVVATAAAAAPVVAGGVGGAVTAAQVAMADSMIAELASELLLEQTAVEMASSNFLMDAGANILSFGLQAQQANLQGDAARAQFLAEQAQRKEVLRQKEIQTAVELDALAQNAVRGAATAKTKGAASGRNIEEMAMQFKIQEGYLAGLQEANLDNFRQNIQQQNTFAARNTNAAIRQAQSATGPLAFAGLGLNIGSAYFDQFPRYNAFPFESQKSYAERTLGLNRV